MAETLQSNISFNTGQAKQSLKEIVAEQNKLKDAVAQTTVVYDELSKKVKSMTKTTTGTKSDGDKLKITQKYKGEELASTKVQLVDSQKEAKGLGVALSQAFNVAKLKVYFNVLSRIGRKLWSFTTMAMDYNETQNKFNVSMGDSEGTATRFVNRTVESVGIARDTLMNYQANFKNIMGGLGDFTSKEAEKISESLVKMSLDYSSLFNVDQEKSASKFQAALVGSIRPIRADSGYDVSDNTIKARAEQLGVEKSFKDLSQVEKRILRIIVLMDQMKNTGAFNDMARTIEQPANQLRVLQNQIREIGIWLGNVFIGVVGQILPYINGFAMAIKELIKLFAMFVGFDADKEAGKNLIDPIEETNNGISGISDGLDKANKKAKELKKTLFSFDVLNVINTPTESSSSGSGGGSGGGANSIDPNILKGLEEYDSMLDNVRMKATDIRDRIMDWLGFDKEINDVTGEIEWKLRDGLTNFEKILDVVKLIGLGIAGWKISSTVLNFFEKLGVLNEGNGFKYAFRCNTRANRSIWNV